MDLTTTARMKPYLDIGGLGEDTLLGYLITSISAQVEDHLDRYAEETARTVYLDVEQTSGHTLEGSHQRFSLRGYPVTSVTSVHNDIDWDFDAADLVDSSEYTVLGDEGWLSLPRYTLSPGPRALKVVYTGGMAANTAAFHAAYPAVELAVWSQLGYVYEKRKFLADSSSAIAGSSVGFQVLELLPEVKKLLQPYRRVTVV